MTHRHSDSFDSAPRAIDGTSRRGLSCARANAPLGLTAAMHRINHDAGRDDGR